MSFDVKRVRAAYPALNDGFAYLDGAAGTQVPASVIDAISARLPAGLGNVGGAFPASSRCGRSCAECRQAVADLAGGQPGRRRSSGPNMTTLTYRLAEALARRWGPGDEVVVSRLDHDANVRPWVQAAARAGATVRWAEVDLATGELPGGAVRRAASPSAPGWSRSPRPATSSAPGPTWPRSPPRARASARWSTWTACTRPRTARSTWRALGADFYATSAYKWSGPHIGAVVADPALLESAAPGQAGARPGRGARSGSSGARRRSPTWPGSSPRWTTWPRSTPRPTGTAPRSGCWPRWPPRGATSRSCSPVLLGGLGAMPHVTLYGKAARRTADRLLHRGRPDARGGGRAPGRAAG